MYKPDQAKFTVLILAETHFLATQIMLPEKLALVAAIGRSLNGRRALQALIGRHSVAGHRVVL